MNTVDKSGFPPLPTPGKTDPAPCFKGDPGPSWYSEEALYAFADEHAKKQVAEALETQAEELNARRKQVDNMRVALDGLTSALPEDLDNKFYVVIPPEPNKPTAHLRFLSEYEIPTMDLRQAKLYDATEVHHHVSTRRVAVPVAFFSILYVQHGVDTQNGRNEPARSAERLRIAVQEYVAKTKAGIRTQP